MIRDVVIPYRQSYSEELRYVLRSLRNVKHGTVYIIGDRPAWVKNIIHIPFKQTSNIAKNTLDIMNIACNDPDISEEFIWLHDDMYFMKPTRAIRRYHRGRYADLVHTYIEKKRTSYYINRMKNTYRRLLELGVKQPLVYELHIPFIISKSKWREISHLVTEGHNKLSMYGNLHNVGGSKIRDVKVRRKENIPAGNYASSYDGTFGINALGNKIRELFPERSEYEI